MAMNELRQLRGLRMLVAEDELLISQLVREILVALQCTVIGPARNLDEAMQAIRTNGMDGALLDVQLGEVSIYPAIDELVRRGIPFILVTGQASLDRFPALLRNAPILTKPFRAQQLENMIRSTFRPQDRGELQQPGRSLFQAACLR